MDRKTLLWMGFLALMLVGGCVQRSMTVTSNPPGALVYMNDQEFGRTPVTRDFTWYGIYDVQLRMDGYETLDTKAEVIAPFWLWPPLDLLTEMAPWHVKDRRSYHFDLQPTSTEPLNDGVMLARAADLRGQLRSSPYTRAPTTRPTTVPSK